MRESVASGEQNPHRRLLAQEAARLMTCESVDDYDTARRLAASRLRISARRFWPSDEEVLAAAQEWRRIYHFSRGEGSLNRLRRLACEAMEFLDGFSPRLTGGVATGAAGEHATISLEVFADPAEEVLKKLFTARIPYSVHDKPGRGKGAQEVPSTSEVRFFVDGAAVGLRIWPPGYRQQLLRRRESPRLTLREVRLLLENEAKE